MIRFLSIFLIVLGSSGCAITRPWGQPVSSEPTVLAQQFPKAQVLHQVPFYPQADYQCGPAAVAMVLGDYGVAVTPNELVDVLYVPGSKGSYQAEVPAVIRSYGGIPYPLGSELSEIKSEVAAGRPVLVFQNLAFKRFPRWHFAVVVGYDQETKRLFLRSGKQALIAVDENYFLHSWQIAGSWAYIVLDANDWPSVPDAQRYVQAVSAFDLVPAGGEIQYPAFKQAVQRWPNNPQAWFGYANALLGRGEHDAAIQAYSRVLQISSEHVPALNNLAWLLNQSGCQQSATALINKALALTDDSSLYWSDLLETKAEISQATASSAACRLTPAYN